MKEKLLKKAKAQRNWGICITIIVLLGLLGGLDGSSDDADLILGSIMIGIGAVVLFVLSSMNKKKAILINGIEEVVGVEVENDEDINKVLLETNQPEKVGGAEVIAPNHTTQKEEIDVGRIINIVSAVIIILILCCVLLPNLFKNVMPASDESIIEAAESKAKSIVTEAVNEIPDVESEILAEGDEWTLVKVSYKVESNGFPYEGTFIFNVGEVGSEARVYSQYKESAMYDVEVSEEEIEKIKIEWELD